MINLSQTQLTLIAIIFYTLSYFSGFIQIASGSIKNFQLRSMVGLGILFLGFSYVYLLGFVGMEALRKMATDSLIDYASLSTFSLFTIPFGKPLVRLALRWDLKNVPKNEPRKELTYFFELVVGPLASFLLTVLVLSTAVLWRGWN